MRIINTALIASLYLSICAHNLSAQGIFDIARSGSSDALMVMLDGDPSIINEKNPEGYSPLILAAYYSNTPVVKALLSNGALVNEKSGYGTALMAATVKGKVKIVKILLEHKADPNVVDTNGTTALLYATMFQHSEITALLLNHNADISLKDNRGNTALDYAILMKNETLVNLLNKHL